jgi:hypothetical protein
MQTRTTLFKRNPKKGVAMRWISAEASGNAEGVKLRCHSRL